MRLKRGRRVPLIIALPSSNHQLLIFHSVIKFLLVGAPKQPAIMGPY